VTDFNPSSFGRLEVDCGISSTGRSNQLKIRQAINKRRSHWCSLAHNTHHVERHQPLHEGFQFRDVIVEHLDLVIARNRRPVRHFQRDILIVVQHRYFNG
jgi:hypothetical protein